MSRARRRASSCCRSSTQRYRNIAPDHAVTAVESRRVLTGTRRGDCASRLLLGPHNQMLYVCIRGCESSNSGSAEMNLRRRAVLETLVWTIAVVEAEVALQSNLQLRH